ncbi:MAG: shikimate kinase [Lachnospiraceae bacterium]|nr:shikimate kinase [Lachnospiraceae bacterium]
MNFKKITKENLSIKDQDILKRLQVMKEKQKGAMFPYNILLIGFMGSGKTTISDCLSQLFDMEIIDMDQEIVKKEDMTIPEIFKTKGEEYFRDAETNLLIELQSKTNTIISCGGGTAMRERNKVEMKKNGRVVLLTASPETILERVKDNHDRPLLEGRKTVEYISELMDQRRPKYEAAADIVISTDQKSVLEICEEIALKAAN